MNLKQLIKKIINRAIPDSIKRELQELPYGAQLSYSQEGEDMILERFLEGQKIGFFVDIGAHHPIRFSNTYHFYKKGWRGINIDATPGSMNSFKEIRSEDTNIEMGITPYGGELTYHIFYESALNTFSEERVKKILNETSYKLEKTVKVKTKTLGQMFEENLAKTKKIDFLTIDVEGLDLEILQTNNWEKFKPVFILIEDLNGSLENIKQSKLYNYLNPLGYSIVAKSYNTVLFKKN